MKTKEKKRKNKKNIVSDFVIFPLTILILFIACFMIYCRSTNTVPQVFGYSYVRILSPSMVASGFNVNDTVIIRNESDYNVGDIIAFYDMKDPANPEPENYVSSTTSIKSVKRSAIVKFHQIIDVTIDSKGVKWFKTKGSSNTSPDITLIKQPFVVGKYIEVGPTLKNVANFLGSPSGIITILLLPNGILLFFLVFELINEIEMSSYENKVLKGKISLLDPECRKKNVGPGFSKSQKEYLVSLAPEEQKDEFKNILYSDDEQ